MPRLWRTLFVLVVVVPVAPVSAQRCPHEWAELARAQVRAVDPTVSIAAAPLLGRSGEFAP